MTKQLEGRVAIVTGVGPQYRPRHRARAGGGGAAVVVNARENLKQAEGVVREIGAAGGKALAVTADVADPEAVQKMAAATVKRFGRIDISSTTRRCAARSRSIS